MSLLLTLRSSAPLTGLDTSYDTGTLSYSTDRKTATNGTSGALPFAVSVNGYSSGKRYAEILANTAVSCTVGICGANVDFTSWDGGQPGASEYQQNGNIYHNGTNVGPGGAFSLATWTTASRLAIYVNWTSGLWWAGVFVSGSVSWQTGTPDVSGGLAIADLTAPIRIFLNPGAFNDQLTLYTKAVDFVGTPPTGASGWDDATSTGIHGTASGSISLTGTSAVTAKVHGSGAGTLGLSGASAINVKLHAVGSGAMSLSGSSTGTVHNPAAHGAASGSLSLSGSGTAKLAVHAAGLGSISLTGAAQASLKVRASASGSIGLSGSGTAKIALHGAAAGVLSLSGIGSAKAKLKAGASSSLPLSGLGAATVKIHAAGAGSLPLTGSGGSHSGVHAAGSGSLPLSGTATVKVPGKVAGSGYLPLSGTAAAKARAKATASGILPLTGSARSSSGINATTFGLLSITGGALGKVSTRVVLGSAAGRLNVFGASVGAVIVHLSGIAVPANRTTQSTPCNANSQSAQLRRTSSGSLQRTSYSPMKRAA